MARVNDLLVSVGTTAAQISATTFAGGRQMIIQPDSGNTTSVFIGGSTVTTTSGYILTSTGTPLVLGGNGGVFISPGDVYLIAANTTQKVRVLTITQG